MNILTPSLYDGDAVSTLSMVKEIKEKVIQCLRVTMMLSNVSGQILLMSPIPIVAKAYSMIRQKEKQKEGYSLKTTPNTALSSHLKNSMNTYNNNSRFERNYNSSETSSINYSQNKSSAKRGNYRKGVICGNYGKEWHTKEECYKLVRYPVRHHPLHGKYKPPIQTHRNGMQNITVHMTVT
ncbi:hypothetical protein Tco_0697068 [Tanacetum coccineum]